MRTLLAVAVALVTVLPACSAFGGSAPFPVGDLLLTGVVAEAQHSATGSGLLVEAETGDPCGIRATADAGTRVYARDATGTLAVLPNAGAIAVGDRVEVYVVGPVAESCPLQGQASSLVVVR